MKIITKAFFDGKLVSREEAKTDYLDRFPDPEQISKTISELRNSSESNWGFIILISDNGISTSPITDQDLTIDY